MADEVTKNLKVETKHLRAFLTFMGIEADVELDQSGQPLISMETEQFNQHRAWVETWYALRGQRDGYSYFYELPLKAG